MTGSNRVELVKNLRAFADNLDGTPADTSGSVVERKVTAKPAATKPTKAAAPVEEVEGDDDDDFVTDSAKNGESFDDDTTEESASFDDAADEEPPKKAAPAKGTKAAAKKKITLDDVNDACKAHAQANGRPATLAILKKKFKTESVTALKPEQYEACISAMAVN